MGELSDQERERAYQNLVRRWLPELLAVFLRSVRDPALAYDLVTETLATARLKWEYAPDGDEAVGWLLRLGTRVLGHRL